MRLPHKLERLCSPFLRYEGFRSKLAGFRVIALVLAVLLGSASALQPALADPVPDEVLDSMFAWVVDQNSAEFAYAMTAGVLDPEARTSMQERLLLLLWLRGGNPWKLNPNWVAPICP